MNDNKSIAAVLKTLDHAEAALLAYKAGVWERESPPSLFLKHADNDVPAAAQRLAYYWQERALVFGDNDNDITKPIEDCLTEEHRKWLTLEGVTVVLPGHDTQGRRVLLAAAREGIPNFKRVLCLSRFVSLHKLMMQQQDDSQQKNEIVLIRVIDAMVDIDARFSQRSQHVLANCFPICIQHIRLVCVGTKSYIQQTMLPMILTGLGKSMSKRCKAHVVSDICETQAQLSDILQANQLPTWVGGTWTPPLDKVTACSNAMLERLTEIVKHVPDQELMEELRKILQDDETDVDEDLLLEIVDSLLQQRDQTRQTDRVAEQAMVQMVFGVARLLQEESPGSTIQDLLQDDQANDILRGLWKSPTIVTGSPRTVVSNEQDAVSELLATITDDNDCDHGQKENSDPAEQRAYADEMHAKFRSALSLLRLFEETESCNPLQDPDKVALVCALVELSYRDCDSTTTENGEMLDRLADRLVMESSDTPALTHIPAWLRPVVQGLAVE